MNQIKSTFSSQSLIHLFIDYTVMQLSNIIGTHKTLFLNKQLSWKPKDGINVSISSLEIESGVRSAPTLLLQKGMLSTLKQD